MSVVRRDKQRFNPGRPQCKNPVVGDIKTSVVPAEKVTSEDDKREGTSQVKKSGRNAPKEAQELGVLSR